MYHSTRSALMRPSRLRLALLLVASLLLAACSHDRYLFLERADLADLQEELSAQRAQVESLERLSAQQFDLLETREQMRQSTTLDRFEQLRDRIDQLSRATLAANRPPPTSSLQLEEGGQGMGRYQGKLIVGEVGTAVSGGPGHCLYSPYRQWGHHLLPERHQYPAFRA